MYLFERPVVFVGIIIVTLLIIAGRKLYGFPAWKLAIFVPVLVDCGLFSEKLLYYFNYGTWGGNYFYGITIFLPLFIILLALILRMNYLSACDLAAPLSVFLLAFGKMQCFLDGCCSGIALFEMSNGETFYFPSRSAEFVCALLMTALFIWLKTKPKNYGMVYGYYCIIYGVQRIFFEEMRIEEAPTRFGLPVAEFWSIFIIFMGIAWLLVVSQYKKKSKGYQKYLDKQELITIAAREEAKIKKQAKKKVKTK